MVACWWNSDGILITIIPFYAVLATTRKEFVEWLDLEITALYHLFKCDLWFSSELICDS